MTGEYTLKVRNKRISFEIKIKQSVIIISGDSGSGKTTFINMLENALSGSVTGVFLDTNYDKNKIEVIRNVRQLDIATKLGDRDKIYVMDENVNLEKCAYFVEYLKSSGSYLIYITRKNITGLLQFSADDIYVFKSDTLNNFTNVSMYPRY